MEENTPTDFLELRQKAEDHLAKQPVSKTPKLSEGDLMKLLHELQVHQIELEMQNEELIQAKEQALSDMGKYTDLYDFVPSGLLTISDTGIIINLNYNAAKLLGNNRINLKNTPFIQYVHPDGITLYNQLFKNAFKSDSKKPTELLLISKTETPTCVHVDTIASEIKNQLWITLVDITDLKRKEEKARIKLNDLKEINNHFLCRELKLMEIKEEVNNLLLKLGCEEQYLI